MKKLIVYIWILLVIFGLTGCTKEIKKFSLDQEYYNNDEYVELDEESFKKLIEKEKSFALFIYQPMCSTSYEFNKILDVFVKENSISFYKMPFMEMKSTCLKDTIKYYPSVVIFNNGVIVDYLDSNNGEHSNYFKTVDGFTEWFGSYINLNAN